MDNFDVLERLGTVEPPDLMVTARVAAALEGASGESVATGTSPVGRVRRHGPRRRRDALVTSFVAVVVVVVAVVTLTSNGGGLTSPITTSWQAGHTLSSGAGASHATDGHGTWALVDDVLSGTWQQNAVGPPPGYLACPDTSTCFMMSGNYASDSAGAATSESLYASTDFGSTWTAYPMPGGFVATTSLVCNDATDCAAAGNYDAQPVLVTTSDGGHSFVIDPLPSDAGSIYSLSCPTSQFCAGLAATTSANIQPVDATLLTTTDGGVQFSDVPIVAGDSMQEILCTSVEDCTAIGVNDSLAGSPWTASVSAVTTDGGQSWSSGTFPDGFALLSSPQISCADASHCSVIGNIQIPLANPPECANIKPAPPKTAPSAPLQQSPSIRAIAKLEYGYAVAAYKAPGGNTFTCLGGSSSMIISNVASTSDGGLSWTPELLPSDVPQPQLSGISCPSDAECWVSGSTALPQTLGKAIDGGASVLLGTTDGGSAWSRVLFAIPSGAPNYDGQAFQSVAFMSCPSDDDCAANGAGAQGAPGAPFYTLRVPSNAT
jgi:photosystem II stability/assembly factor-like uncharacterized protein